MTNARDAITEYLNGSIASGGKGWTTRQHADAIIAAIAAAGLVIVPKEPTTAMVRASTCMAPTWDDDVSRAKWRAMVEAATDE